MIRANFADFETAVVISQPFANLVFKLHYYGIVHA